MTMGYTHSYMIPLNINYLTKELPLESHVSSSLHVQEFNTGNYDSNKQKSVSPRLD